MYFFAFLTNNLTKESVDITAGRGPGAFSFLSRKNFTPSQHWTHHNNGKITNKNNGYCLVGDNRTDNIYVDICNQQNPVNNTQFTWLNTGQFQFAGNREKCISIKKYPYQNRKINRLTLENCNGNAKQKWFIG